MSIKYQGFVGLVESFPLEEWSLPDDEPDHDGRLVTRELGGSTPTWTTPTIISQVRRHIYSMTLAKKQVDMYRPMSIALTLLSLAMSSADDKKVIAFVPCSTMGLRVQEGLTPKADLVALLTSLDMAREVIKGDKVLSIAPAANEVVAIAEISNSKDPMDLCLHNMVLIAQSRPLSASQFGLAITKRSFRLLEVGLDYTKAYKIIGWQSKTIVEELYSVVKLIRNESLQSDDSSSMIPRLSRVLRTKRTLLATYTASANGKRYDLFPIFHGRDPHRRPFVALASCGRHLKDSRILKYAWRQEDRPHLEYQILKKTQDVPGVIQLDDELSSSRVKCDPLSGFVQSVLATKVTGFPLCSCRSVKEFLEAMYDLLEVLRYLAHEKKILHRDINWRSVLLVRPEDAPEINNDIISKETDAPIKHRYRFISNIYNEEKTRVRVALCDFDQAVDLSTGLADDLSNVMSTRMFLAHDIFETRLNRLYSPVRLPSEAFAAENGKYYSVDEKNAWDEFYSKVQELYSALPKGSRNNGVRRDVLVHTAAHDAESVFYLCMLFFCRMAQRQLAQKNTDPRNVEHMLFSRLLGKHIGYYSRELLFSVTLSDEEERDVHPLLSLVAEYLRVPWSMLDSTARGGRYEFHLHDFLQRLILKELIKMREQGDDIHIYDLPNFAWDYTGDISYVFRGVAVDLPILLNKWQDEVPAGEGSPTVLGKHKREDESKTSNTCAGLLDASPVDKHTSFGSERSMQCPPEFADFLRLRKSDNYWLAVFDDYRRSIERGG